MSTGDEQYMSSLWKSISMEGENVPGMGARGRRDELRDCRDLGLQQAGGAVRQVGMVSTDRSPILVRARRSSEAHARACAIERSLLKLK